VDQKHTSLREDLHRAPLLLAHDSRPGFRAGFGGLTRRGLDRLPRPGVGGHGRAPRKGANIQARPTNHRPYRQRPRGWSATKGAEGPVSGPSAAGAKARSGPEAAPVRPTRARREPAGLINEDAAKRNGFPSRGALQNIGFSTHGTLPPDVAARAVGLERNGPPSIGPGDVNGPSDPTTAGDERGSRGRARGRGEGEG
jgi:hypothetical protein